MRAAAAVVLVMVGCGVDESGAPTETAVAPATTYDCMTVSAGQGFQSIPIVNATVLDTVSYTITTDTAPIDAVVGLSAGTPTAFSSFAISARLAPSGQVDARDGDTYRASASYAYSASWPMQFRIVADLTSHTYALEDASGDNVAGGYHFRTSQSSVTHLDHFGVIVDSSVGTVQVCPTAAVSSGIRYSHTSLFAPWALPNGGALLQDYTGLTKLDVSGHPVASVARGGGFSFTDTLGNVFYVTLSSNVLSLEKLDANLVSQWVKTRTLPDGHVISTFNGDGSGGAVIATRNYSAGSMTVFRFTSAGVFLGSHSTLGTGAAVDGNGAFIIRITDTSSVRISKYSKAWQLLWSKTYTGSANVASAVAAPDGGIVFGGSMSTPMNFGGSTLPVDTEMPRHNGYLVRLASDGSHVFSQRTDGDWTRALATNGHWIVMSDSQTLQQQYVRLSILTMTGTPAPDAPAFDTSLGPLGQGLEVALSADNRIYWNMMTEWPANWQFEYLLAL